MTQKAYSILQSHMDDLVSHKNLHWQYLVYSFCEEDLPTLQNPCSGVSIHVKANGKECLLCFNITPCYFTFAFLWLHSQANGKPS